RNKSRMGVWQAMEYLNTLVDDSDPDTDLSQIEHLLQTAEACRRDGRPRWFILTGLVHDLGKILCLYGEPQWAVVGDTFPVGCAFSPKVVFSEFFASNPDSRLPRYQTKLGVYEEGCGLDKVDLSWGHDEYIYHVAQDYLPEAAGYMLRYHSFYPAHLEGEYQYLMSDHDQEMFKWVREFSQYDLYSKSSERHDAELVEKVDPEHFGQAARVILRRAADGVEVHGAEFLERGERLFAHAAFAHHAADAVALDDVGLVGLFADAGGGSGGGGAPFELLSHVCSAGL